MAPAPEPPSDERLAGASGITVPMGRNASGVTFGGATIWVANGTKFGTASKL
jgi:hypothetical protein